MPLFPTFFGGGFECSTHRRARDRQRLDVIAGSGHDRWAEEDYRALAAHGLDWARDGLRWHLVEQRPERYDWSSWLPLLRASRGAGLSVVWDLCHYGVPDDVDFWRPAFVDRFARFARAAAHVFREETDAVPWWCPVNEISFWSFAGGKAGFFPPFARNRGFAMKLQLVRASIAAIEAVREVDPRARLLLADPVIHITHDPARLRDRGVAAGHRRSQFQGWDLLVGRLRPDLGGREDYLDVLGANYYPYNQWIHNGPKLDVGHPLYRPLRHILAEVHVRYGRPVVVAETGCEGERRPLWLSYIGDEVRAAQRAGAAIDGICLYPVADHPGWEDDRHCPNGLFGYADGGGRRPVYVPLARELRRQQALFASAGPNLHALPLPSATGSGGMTDLKAA